MLQEQKPKKPPRKKPKASAMIRPGKRYKKKKKFPISSSSSSSSIQQQTPLSKALSHPNHQVRHHEQDNQFLHQNSGDLLASSINARTNPLTTHLTYKTDDTIVNKVVTSSESVGHDMGNYKINHHINNHLPVSRHCQDIPGNVDVIFKTHIGSYTTCENSHESSEDTGVGGLSESELIGKGCEDLLRSIKNF